jgi:hypothetical protein
MKTKMKKNIFIGFLLLSSLLAVNAQNTTFNNVAIGLNDPDWGVNIKTNFPGYTGNWSRGFFVSNETGGQHLLSIFAQGQSVNGVSSLISSSIGKDFGNPYITFLPNGNVGIGAINPSSPLHIKNSYDAILSLQTSDDAWLYTEYRNSGLERKAWVGLDGGLKSFNIAVENGTDKILFNGGNVGIGTYDPDSKLTVNGKIHAQEVKIDLLSPMTVPDYVFASDYKLKTLQEVEEYIKENSHLPEIPSAKEIEKNGLMLAEMNMSLLKKMEEMTLYMIEQEKKNNVQSKEIESLKKENESFKTLSERFSKIENQLKINN